MHSLRANLARFAPVSTWGRSGFTWSKSGQICHSKAQKGTIQKYCRPTTHYNRTDRSILAEGAIALLVTLSGSALFASWKLLQFPSRLIVKVIRAIFKRASAQLYFGFFIIKAWQRATKVADVYKRIYTFIHTYLKNKTKFFLVSGTEKTTSPRLSVCLSIRLSDSF